MALTHRLNRTQVKRFVVFMLVWTLLVMSVVAVSAQSVVIDIDPNDIFSQINQWIPVFLPLMLIPAGIALAILIINAIVNAIKKAFERLGD